MLDWVVNYLAHLLLSPPDDLSRLGNILADFLRGVDQEALPLPVQQGIKLHQKVDGFTDAHPDVRELRRLFSPARRRFSGVILDVVFDHYLIKHWSNYSDCDFDEFVDSAYSSLGAHTELMPDRMQLVVSWMTQRDWIRSYAELKGIGRALDGLAGRLKMNHSFHGSIEEVEEHYPAIEQGFLRFFPQLIEYVEDEKMTSNAAEALLP